MKRSKLHDHFYELNNKDLTEEWAKVIEENDNLIERIRNKDGLLVIAFLISFFALVIK